MIRIYDNEAVEKECEVVIKDPSGNDKAINFILYNGEWLLEGEYVDERPCDWEEYKELK